MQKHHKHGALYSASDLVGWLGCRHRTSLDLKRLNGWDGETTPPDEAAQLVQRYGIRHEHDYLDELRRRGLQICEITQDDDLDAQVRATREAMAQGFDVIYQAALLQPPFVGYADFLIRVVGASKLGDYHYELADTKLAKSNQAKFLIQLGLYADLLTAEQGLLPTHLHVVLGKLTERDRQIRGLPAGTDNVAQLKTQDCIYYVRSVCAEFLKFVRDAPHTEALPVAACDLCRWRTHCENGWAKADHVCLVANIRRSQVDRLREAGISTMRQLGSRQPISEPGFSRIKGIDGVVLDKLQRQAALQTDPRDAQGKLSIYRIPPDQVVPPRGFALLPIPDPADLYFDMEGFPHEPGGLEYLFGVGWRSNKAPDGFAFKPFWAHNHAEEKRAFEDFMDFVRSHLERHPKAHIYHYAAYERSAIERLSSVHDTRTEFRDQLFRDGRLVDLYRVLRGALLLALPSYSIKKVEQYYRPVRAGNVVDAGQSIVKYEAARLASQQTERDAILRDIEAYNRDDVESTRQLHEWLEQLRPSDCARPLQSTPEPDKPAAPSARTDAEQRELAAKSRLAEWAARNPSERGPLSELLSQILGFYWRCSLPGWWRHYRRLELDADDLLEDLDCLAGLEQEGTRTAEKRSYLYRYRVPVQESKIATGATVACLTDGLTVSNFEYDEAGRYATFTRSRSAAAPPRKVDLCTSERFDESVKLTAIYGFIDDVCTEDRQSTARELILTRSFPRVTGINWGAPLMPAGRLSRDEEFTQVLSVAMGLDHSHLVIQGPPGTGKTTIAAKLIAALLRDGTKVAVTSNSHAAINNLLTAAWARVSESRPDARAAVVNSDSERADGIEVVSPPEVTNERFDLVGGTAWLWSREAQREKWDYLFVDEASQVSLADVLAAGSAARNIILLGDQMQLPQPSEGIHPGNSGLSVLEFLLDGHQTVPTNRGIFLGTTYRMHPALCEPISAAVYDGRLKADASCDRQSLLVDHPEDDAIQSTGVVWIPVSHENRSQSAPEEVVRIETLYRTLLKQRWRDNRGVENNMTPQDVLVLAPYNAQVRTLRSTLGADARVGTVDKFQGQEAAVSIISMTSSDSDSMPRGLDFLFSVNRLNVAITRARCVAFIVGSPKLKTPHCSAISDLQRASFFNFLVSH